MAKKYFARANTSSGCVSLMKSNLQGISEICTLTGQSRAVKGQLLGAVAGYFDSRGARVECIYSPFDVSRPEAVILPEYGFAAADEACAPGGGMSVATDEFINESRLEASAEYLCGLSETAQKSYSRLWAEYEKAKQIHDEWEQLYISSIDFDRLNGYGDGLINRLISREAEHKSGIKRERFFGASTMDGSVNFIDNITSGLEKRYFIKGRPGTGKSTFLKKLAAAALAAGYDVEVYYCSFDKNSLDMVLVPELSFCVFDSTAPHEMFPSSERDSIFDFYKEGGLEGFDERNERQLSLLSRKYSFRIFRGVAHLRIAAGCELEREFYLSRAADEAKIAQTADKLIRRITG